MNKICKRTLSALAVSAVVMLALLSNGCNKNPDITYPEELIGSWRCEFEEEEFGGDCSAEYSFKKDGEATFCLCVGEGEQYLVPLVWYTEGNKLYITQKEEQSDDDNLEWDEVVYNVKGTTLEFNYYGEITDFTRND